MPCAHRAHQPVSEACCTNACTALYEKQWHTGTHSSGNRESVQAVPMSMSPSSYQGCCWMCVCHISKSVKRVLSTPKRGERSLGSSFSSSTCSFYYTERPACTIRREHSQAWNLSHGTSGRLVLTPCWRGIWEVLRSLFLPCSASASDAFVHSSASSLGGWKNQSLKGRKRKVFKWSLHQEFNKFEQ